MFSPLELSEHLPHLASGGMETNDGQLRHVASVYEADRKVKRVI